MRCVTFAVWTDHRLGPRAARPPSRTPVRCQRAGRPRSQRLGFIRRNTLVAMAIACMVLLCARFVDAQSCPGDCNGDGEVSINELIIGVNIALGAQAATACAAMDSNGDGAVTVNELIRAVSMALNGCPARTVTPTATATDTETPTPPPATDTPAATPTAPPATETAAATPLARLCDLPG